MKQSQIMVLLSPTLRVQSKVGSVCVCVCAPRSALLRYEYLCELVEMKN